MAVLSSLHNELCLGQSHCTCSSWSDFLRCFHYHWLFLSPWPLFKNLRHLGHSLNFHGFHPGFQRSPATQVVDRFFFWQTSPVRYPPRISSQTTPLHSLHSALTHIIAHFHGLQYHFYANHTHFYSDDTRLYISITHDAMLI